MYGSGGSGFMDVVVGVVLVSALNSASPSLLEVEDCLPLR